MPLILLNKPYQVLCQFRDRAAPGCRPRATLADYLSNSDVYPAGRLDYDSEGLLLLTDDGHLQARISSPGAKITKTYWVQVEGDPSEHELAQLVGSLSLRDGPATALFARRIGEPADLWPRDPPIRVRRTIPVAWLEIGINEGRNRQVRRMTAAVGLPTLRLIRAAVGPWALGTLQPGDSHTIETQAAWQALKP